jgi:hypothetical protein
MRTALRRGACAALLLGLAVTTSACGLGPFEATPRAPFRTAPDAHTPRIGVCYNALFSKPEEVREVAKEACLGIGEPRLAEQDQRLACPLLTPTRATFDCVSE